MIDVGDGLAIAFKVESHNHPSAVEPYQGAATGRRRHPARHLRDGRAADRAPRLAAPRPARRGAPARAVPRRSCAASAATATASASRTSPARRSSTPAYRAEPARQRDLHRPAARRRARARAAPPGRATSSSCSAPRTGRDGIGGASVLASQDLDESDEDKRPSVQVGDPFTGKKLIECTLELAARGLVVSRAGPGRRRPRLVDVRDGRERRRRASSWSSSACRCARQGMQPFEIMISESQERMCADRRARAPGRGARPSARAGSSPCTAIGRGHRRRPAASAAGEGEVVGDMPADGARRRARATRSTPSGPTALRRAVARAGRRARGRATRRALLLRLLGRAQHLRQDAGSTSSTTRSSAPARCCARAATRRRAADAVRARDRGRARRRRRARLARPARAAAPRRSRRRRSTSPCTRRRAGGDHELPQLRQPGARRARPTRCARRSTGMAEACEALGTPVVSGNVSLYNEHGGRPIHPTPVVGCVGVLERADARRAARRLRDAERRALPARRRPAPRLRRLGVAGARSHGARTPAASPRSTCPRCAGSATCSAELAREAAAALARTTPPTAASPSRWPRSRWPPAAASTSTLEPARRRGRRRCSASAAASSSRAARRPTRRAWSRRCDAARRARSSDIGALGGAAIALRCGELALDAAAGRRARGLRWPRCPRRDGRRV